MKTLKFAVVALFTLLLSTGLASAEDADHGYSRIFIFGASFIDPGNRYADTGEVTVPPFLDPFGPVAYDVGGHRATNGRTWVEVMAHEMKLTKWGKPAFRHTGFGNYAYDHARVRDVEPPYIVWGPSMPEQIERWKADGFCDGSSMNDTLFVLDSGGADLLDIMMLPQGPAQFAVIEAVADTIKAQIEDLYDYCGARNFLVADLFPVGYAPGVGNPAGANMLAAGFNAVLQGRIDAILADSDYLSAKITTTGFFEFGMTLVAFAEEFGFTNVTDTCITYFVVEDAYCDKPKEYFWWDALHPTKAVHALLGRHALGQLPVPD